MDPSLTDPQATVVWNPPEQLNYTAPAPNPAPNNGHNYPSYPEMISAAIGALRERDGSSRQAIARYIEQVFTNLPADNAALLTRHLKCMKQAGRLVMVKHSYAIPGSVFLLPQSVPIGNGTGVVSPNSATVAKRRPGRPCKPKPDNQLVVPTPMNQLVVPTPVNQLVVPTPMNQLVVPTPMNQLAVPTPVQDSVFVSLGLMDESPDEDDLVDEPMAPESDLELEPVIEPPVLHQELAIQPVLGKRGRGRPPKIKYLLPAPQPAPIDNKPAPTNQTELKRRPGRPRKFDNVGRMLPRVPNKFPYKPTGLPRGRPRKYMVVPPAEAQAAVVGVGVTLPAKRRGRKKGSRVVKKKVWSGKPLGRPKKIMLIESANQQVPTSADLVKNLEHIQAKIKQVVNVVKPHLDTTTTASACQALQELEQLAWQNLYAPLNIEVQLPVLTPVAASPAVLAPSQEPVLVQPPAHFAVASAVPIADPNVFPAAYQEHYQGH